MTYRLLVSLLFCLPLCATVNVKDYGAVGDGSTNDTAAINAAFAAGCSTSDSVYIPAGIYSVDPLDHLSACSATFYGDGSGKSTIRFRSAVSGYFQNLLSFESGAGRTLTFNDFALDGRHAELAGLAVSGYGTVNVNRIASYNFGVPGYSQGHSKPLDGLYIQNSTNVTVKNSIFTGNERMGVELQAINNSTVDSSTMSGNGGMGGVSEQNFSGPLAGPIHAVWSNNTFQGNGSGCIDVETDPSLPPAQGIITGNHCSDSGNNNWDSGWGIVLGLHAYGQITGNNINNYGSCADSRTVGTGYNQAIVLGTPGGPITISNNIVKGTRSSAVLAANSPYAVTISSNTFTSNGSGIDAYSDPGIQITGNTITSNVNYGIALSASSGYYVNGNTLSANNPDFVVNGAPRIQQ